MFLGWLVKSWPERVLLVGFAGVLALIPLADGRESSRVIGGFTVAVGCLIVLAGLPRAKVFAGMSAIPAAVVQSLPLLLLAGVWIAWLKAGDPLDQPGTLPTRAVLCGAVFFLAYGLSHAVGRPETLIGGIVVVVAAYTAYGVGIGAPQWSDVVASYRAAATGHVGGPYLGRDAFAVFAAIGCICALALAASRPGSRPIAWCWAATAGLLGIVAATTGSAVAIGGMTLGGLIIARQRVDRAVTRHLGPLALGLAVVLAGTAGAAAWPAIAGGGIPFASQAERVLALANFDGLRDIAPILLVLAFYPLALSCLRVVLRDPAAGVFPRLGVASAALALIAGCVPDGIGAPAAIALFAAIIGICGAVALPARPRLGSVTIDRRYETSHPLPVSPQSGV